MRRVTGRPPTLLSSSEWLIVLTVSVSLLLVCASILDEYNIATGVAVGMFGATAVHMVFAARQLVPVPHIALLTAILQYQIAPLVAIRYPSEYDLYNIGDNLDEYLTYANLVIIFFAGGWLLSTVRMMPHAVKFQDPSPALLKSFDYLILVGFITTFLQSFFDVPFIGFVFVLVGTLRYVGVLARMIYRAGGWPPRLLLVILSDLIIAVGAAGFHWLVLWVVWVWAVWLFAYTPSVRKVAFVIFVGLFSLIPINQAKWGLRDITFGNEVYAPKYANASSAEKLGIWFEQLGDSVTGVIDGKDFQLVVGQTATRINQGWIVARVMRYVPSIEPYADGQTIIDAIYASVMPRALARDKAEAGGKSNMKVFAGLQLSEGTSMNLGFAGEMYANFGLWGGAVACGVYALFFGLLFRLFCRLGEMQPLWWAFVPTVFYPIVKAEEDIVSVLNWTVKSLFVLLVVIMVAAPIRRVLVPSLRGRP